MQRVEARIVSGRSIESADRHLDGVADPWHVGNEPLEARASDVFFPAARRYPFGIGFGIRRQILQRTEDAEEFVQRRAA